MEESKFRVKKGYTEVKRKSGWVEAGNFNVEVIRYIKRGPDKGGPLVIVKTPFQPDEEL